MLASFINKYIISPKEWSSLIESTRLSHQARNGNRLGWPTSSRRMLLGMEYSLELGFQASLPSVLAGIGCTIFFCTVACWPRPDRIYGSPFFSFPPQVGPTWYWQIPWHVPQSGVEHRARGHTQSLYLAVLCRAALHAGDHTYLRVPLIRVLNAVWTKKIKWRGWHLCGTGNRFAVFAITIEKVNTESNWKRNRCSTAGQYLVWRK